MSSELVEVIERDLREVVEAEIRKFLEHYEDCEIVDALYSHWDFKVVAFDVVIHSLPCDISRYIVLKGDTTTEIPDITCWVNFETEDDEMLLGWIRVVQMGNKCFVITNIRDKDIEDVAKDIVREAEAGE